MKKASDRNRARYQRAQEKKQGKSLNRAMQKKLAILFVGVLLAFIGLCVRLFVINKNDGEEYKKQVLSQQQYDSTVLPFKRGDIVDAKGTKLAYSEKVYNLVIDSKVMHQKEEYIADTMTALTNCFTISENDVRQFVTDNPTDQYKVVLEELTYDEISDFLDLQNDKAKNPNIAGVWFEEEYKRVYPNGSLACDVIGFTTADNIGNSGLEAYYNATLNGINGREYGYLNDESTLERTTKAAVDGNTIVSSIDVNIQSIVEKYILKFNEQHKGEYRENELGSSNTGVIVMKPSTGEILAMASYPSFDLNNPRDLSAFYTPEEIAQMDEQMVYDNLNAIWRNFCISDTYEPGSTAKSMTIAAGLDSGKVIGNETYTCNGYLEVSGHKIHCHKTIGHGVLDVSGALEQSCNVALMTMGNAMGKDVLMKYLSNFNMGLRTNIDLQGEARTDTLIYDVNNMVASDLALSTFGQGYNVTQIQLASAFCSIINGGYYYEPHVINKIQAADGSTVQEIEPRVLKQTISNATSDKMKQYLAAVCSEGTGKKAVPAGYLIGGKTGTAEKFPRNTGNYVVSFIGFAPVDNPQVVVYVVIDEPNVADQPHSDFAQEVAKNILTEILPYLTIYRTEELTPEQIAELEANGLLNGVSGNSTASENIVEESVEETGVAGNEETTEETIDYSKYEVDEETGNLIDPETGKLINPDTFEFVDPNFSLLGE